jgi:hypothetical protein
MFRGNIITFLSLGSNTTSRNGWTTSKYVFLNDFTV